MDLYRLIVDFLFELRRFIAQQYPESVSPCQMRNKSMAKELKGTVKEILGTAFSVGCTVAGKSPRDVQTAIDNGEYFVSFLFAHLCDVFPWLLLASSARLPHPANGPHPPSPCTNSVWRKKPRTAHLGMVVGG